MSNSKNIILVIAPHQDDEIIGCGGTIVSLVEKGYTVMVVHVYSGTSGVGGSNEHESQMIRTAESEEAAKIGGYTLIPSLGYKDRDRSRDTQIQPSIIKLLREVRPSIIFIPHKLETDYEHRLVSLEARESIWLATTEISSELGKPLDFMPRIFYYEVWKNIEAPSVLSDISKYVDKKRQMLEAFTSQMSTSGWINGSLGRNAYRGVTTKGNGYYEVFETENVTIGELIP